MFKADDLVNVIENDQPAHASVVHNVKMLRAVVARMANKAAKANAEFYDDAKGEEYAAYHAPANEQFPQAVRDEAILDLVKYWLKELSIQEKANG